MKQFIQSLKIFLALIIIPILLCGSTAFSKKQIWAAESKQAQLSAGKITEKSSEKNSEKKTILQIQARLTQLGYKPGQLDGIGGRKTENEIKKFQKNHILTITGKLDFETKSKLWPVSSDTTGIKNPKIAEDKDVTVNRFVVMPSHKKSIIFYVNLLLYGSLITFALYYFCLYWLRKKTLSTLYFGFFCLLADFFYLLSIEKPFLLTLTIIDSEFLTRIRLICLCFLITVFILLMNNLYPNDFSKKTLRAFQGINILYIVLAIITNDAYLSYLIGVYWIPFLFFFGYLLLNLFKASLKKNNESFLLFTSHIFLIITFINYLLYYQMNTNINLLIPFGVFFYIFVISVVLSNRFLKSSYRVDIYERFVPKKFLKILGIKDIIDISLGGNAEKHMAILFSDIRDFTSLSENMTPEENFEFINSYLKVMGPIIRKNNGIVDKYIGDAIMALFEKSDDAVQGAIEMIEKLTEYNEGRNRAGYVPIKIGIGINTGVLRIGIIGEHNRMEGTVISDAVNLASRIEGMTKTYGLSILISNETYHCLSDPKKFELREIDRVKAKGKTTQITIWEVFNCDPQNILDFKRDVESIFQEARHLYQARQFEEANELFLNCLARNPKDKTSQFYSDRCKLYMTIDSDENMEGLVRHVSYVTIAHDNGL